MSNDLTHSRNILLHVHIFKNAGSSFDDALSRFFGDDFVDHREDKKIVEGKQEYLEGYLREHKNIRAFSSHSIYFNPKSTDEFTFLPVYFLRHPIDRIRSVYSFEKKQEPATTHGSIMAKKLDFNAFIGWYMKSDSPATIRNAQTIFFAGMGPSPGRIEEKFVQAMKNLGQAPLVGLVDRYDESMVVFEEYLRRFYPDIDLSYIRRNVTDKNFHLSLEDKVDTLLSKLDDETRKSVLENNTFDMRLYEEAKSILDRRIERIEDFENKLRDFQTRCALKLAKQLENNSKDDEVVELLLTYIEKNVKNIHLYIEFFKAKERLGDYEGAIRIAEQACEIFPNNPWVHLYLANFYRRSSEKIYEKIKKEFSSNSSLMKLIAKEDVKQ